MKFGNLCALLFYGIVFTHSSWAVGYDLSSLSEEIPYPKLQKTIMSLEGELINRICSTWNRSLYPVPVYDSNGSPELITCAERDLILTARICKGASREFKAIIKAKFPDLKIDTVTTRSYWYIYKKYGWENFSHTFLRVSGYFKNGEDLYIDPTISQQFINRNNIEQIRHEPKVFVGRFSELNEFLTLHQVAHVEYYLDTLDE